MLCYAAMLSYTLYQANAPALLPLIDKDAHACVLGDQTTVPMAAKIIERAIEGADALGVDAGSTLQTLIRFGLAPKSVPST